MRVGKNVKKYRSKKGGKKYKKNYWEPSVRVERDWRLCRLFPIVSDKHFNPVLSILSTL